MTNNSHHTGLGYALWLFGFTGSHRFYFGKPISGTIYFCTLGLFGIGWVIDLFLIPSMDQEADSRYREGSTNFTVAWLLLTFGGVFGLHRMYMGKWISGLLYFCTGGLFLVGYLYDFWTLNEQVSDVNDLGRYTTIM